MSPKLKAVKQPLLRTLWKWRVRFTNTELPSVNNMVWTLGGIRGQVVSFWSRNARRASGREGPGGAVFCATWGLGHFLWCARHSHHPINYTGSAGWKNMKQPEPPPREVEFAPMSPNSTSSGSGVPLDLCVLAPYRDAGAIPSQVAQ